MSIPALPVDHYRYEAEGFELAQDPWGDWYHEVIFEHEGKKCSLLVYMLLPDGSLGNHPHNHITFTRGNLELEDKVNERLAKYGKSVFSRLRKYKEIKAGEYIESMPFAEDFKKNPLRYSKEDIEFDDLADGSLRVALGPADEGVEFIYKPDGTKIVRANTKNIQTEFVCTKTARTLWWGNKEDYDMPWLKDGSMAIRGTEELCSAEGWVIVDGERIPIKDGISVVEHVWIQNSDLWVFRYMDWIWFHSDKMKGIISHHQMEEGYEVSWGSLYLPEEDRLIYCNSCRFEKLEYAWFPEYMRFVPIKMRSVSKTDEGELNVTVTTVEKPTFRISLIDPDVRADGLQGWVFNLWTAIQEVKGTFTFNDGRVIEIDGLGMNEPQMASPIT